MKSPFPGMDPYLGKHWRDVHARLIIYSCDLLQDQLPQSLLARVEERVFLETEAFAPSRNIYPDLRVVEHRSNGSARARAKTAVLDASGPVVLQLMQEPVTETYLEIIDAATGHRVVTVIEFLSPANKNKGEGQQLYLKKQKEILDSPTTLVEIDLLHWGDRVQAAKPSQVPLQYQTTYQACVRRGWKFTEVEIYPITLQQRLPIIRVPLREQDQDVQLDLQTLIERAYEMGRYGETINYRAPPEPPLTGADAAWAKKLVRAAAKTANGKKKKGK